MFKKYWDAVRRFRTWIFNVVAAALVALPDVVHALVGYNWGEILPREYVPYLTLIIVVINILMRPRPAVLPHEWEAQQKRRK